MKITVAQSWRELTEWQLQEIAALYLDADPEDFAPAFQKMIFILLQPEASSAARVRLQRILSQLSLDQLSIYGQFLLQTTNLHHFPEIPGLTKPADRLASLTAKQFSFADKFFHDWEQDKNSITLRRFVASLYTFGTFNQLDLAQVATITDMLTEKEQLRIALAYKFTQLHIWNTYPVIFPKKKETEEEAFRPVFKKEAPKYQPFDKVILGLVFSDEQPLGTKPQADDTLLYDFLNVYQESILLYEQKQKQNAKHN